MEKSQDQHRPDPFVAPIARVLSASSSLCRLYINDEMDGALDTVEIVPPRIWRPSTPSNEGVKEKTQPARVCKKRSRIVEELSPPLADKKKHDGLWEDSSQSSDEIRPRPRRRKKSVGDWEHSLRSVDEVMSPASPERSKSGRPPMNAKTNSVTFQLPPQSPPRTQFIFDEEASTMSSNTSFMGGRSLSCCTSFLLSQDASFVASQSSLLQMAQETTFLESQLPGYEPTSLTTAPPAEVKQSDSSHSSSSSSPRLQAVKQEQQEPAQSYTLGRFEIVPGSEAHRACGDQFELIMGTATLSDFSIVLLMNRLSGVTRLQLFSLLTGAWGASVDLPCVLFPFMHAITILPEVEDVGYPVAVVFRQNKGDGIRALQACIRPDLSEITVVKALAFAERTSHRAIMLTSTPTAGKFLVILRDQNPEIKAPPCLYSIDFQPSGQISLSFLTHLKMQTKNRHIGNAYRGFVHSDKLFLLPLLRSPSGLVVESKRVFCCHLATFSCLYRGTKTGPDGARPLSPHGFVMTSVFETPTDGAVVLAQNREGSWQLRLRDLAWSQVDSFTGEEEGGDSQLIALSPSADGSSVIGASCQLEFAGSHLVRALIQTKTLRVSSAEHLWLRLPPSIRSLANEAGVFTAKQLEDFLADQHHDEDASEEF